MDSFETICKNATNVWLEKMQNQYKHLIEFNSGQGQIYNKKVGKWIEPGRMPWMVKCYQSGLDIVTNELNNRGADNKGVL